MKMLFRSLLSLFVIGPMAADEKEKTSAPLAALKLPGIKINLEERSVDVNSTVCLQEGSLEFVACTKDTKEHESIISVRAKPSHIHTALLLLGAEAGHPAIRKVVGEGDEERWVDLPPKGSLISVSFVIKNKEGQQIERPLTDFIERSGDEEEQTKEEKAKAKAHLKNFLFAGSHLHGNGEGPKTYLADKSGSVISLSTFGDELLCLPEVYGNENHSLQWQVDSTHLPKMDTKIILRLRPKIKKERAKR